MMRRGELSVDLAMSAAAERRERKERAQDEAVKSLRVAGLMRSLVIRTTGLSPMEDADAANFETALQFVQHNLKHHKFADMGSNGFAVRTNYEEVVDKLERLSEHSKAGALRALCSTLCAPGRTSAWEWNAKEHPTLANGVSALAMLYWLGDTAKMVHAKSSPPRSLSSRSSRRTDSLQTGEDDGGAGAEALERVQWGYSDEEEPDDADADAERTGGVAELRRREAAEGQRAYQDGDSTGGGAAGAMDATGTVVSAGGGSSEEARRIQLLAARACFGRPPAGLRPDLLQGGTASAAAGDGERRGREDTSVATIGGDARQRRLAQLRLLREYLRALAQGAGGAEWKVLELDSPAPPAASSGGGAAPEGDEGAPTHTHASASASSDGLLPARGTGMQPPRHLSVRLDASRARDALCAQPSSLLTLVPTLERLGACAVDLRHFAHAIASRRAAPSVLLALSDALLEELQPLSAFLWRSDADARRAQQAAAANQPPRGAYNATGKVQEPSLLGMVQALRRGGGGGGGWMRKLRALDGLRSDLVASDALRALASGEALPEDGAAAAAAHTLNTLARACEAAQLLGGDVPGEGAPQEDGGWRPGPGEGGARGVAARGKGTAAGGGGGGGGGEEEGGDDAGRLPSLFASTGAGAMSLLPMWLRLLVAALLPYLRGVQSWVCDGRIHDRAGELLFHADESIPTSDAEAHWKFGFVLRPASSIPTLLQPLAPAILLAGKSRHLLHRMQQAQRQAHAGRGIGGAGRGGGGRGGVGAGTEAVGGGGDAVGGGGEAMSGEELFPLDAAFCDALEQAMRRPRPRPSSAPPLPIEPPTTTPALPASIRMPRLGRDLRLSLPRTGLLPPSGAVPKAAEDGATAGGLPTEAEAQAVGGGSSLGGGPQQQEEQKEAAEAVKADADNAAAAAAGRAGADSPSAKAGRAASEWRGFAMAACPAFEAPRAATRERSTARRLLDARRGLCFLPTATPPLSTFDGDAAARGRLDALRDALGCRPRAHAAGGEAPGVTSAVLSLPPLALLFDACLGVPIQSRCATAGPLLLAAVSSHFDPLLAASLVHRVLLFADPRLTAPLFEQCLFERLSREHRAWRRQLPELHATLVEALLAADVPPVAARSFALELRAAPLDHGVPPLGRREVGGEVGGAEVGGAGPGGAVPRGAGVLGHGLDATDVSALGLLRLHFCARWPLALVLSEAALEAHERVFHLLLQLRRSRWALETADADGAERRRVQGGMGSSGGARERQERHSAHPWRVLRAEVLHIIGALYSHLALGVINPEWKAFSQRAAQLTHVDAFREAHEAFSRRLLHRCLLGPRDAAIRSAIETILALALRLRVQLDSLPVVGAQAHAASAMRWRAELRECVRFVLDALRAAGEKESRRELLDLCRLLSFNDYYEREGFIVDTRT